MIIDISHYQTVKDWKKVAQTVDTVIIKSSQGVNFLDPMFLTHAKNAKNAGLKVGYYHFASLNDKDEVKDAKLEAQWFAKAMKMVPKSDLPLALDIEENPSKLDKVEVLTWINTFFYELSQLGFTNYMIYSFRSFLDSNLPSDHKLGNIPLWLASFTPTYKVPVGWKKPYIWQYSDKGKVPGINGAVDLDKLV